jgi:hypothetical protein
MSTTHRLQHRSPGLPRPRRHPALHTDDHEVQGQAPVAHVVEVVLYTGGHLLHGFGLAPVAVDLGPAGDAGLDLVAQHVAGDELAVELVVGDGVGAGADDAHAALEDVDELRQFVQGGLAQEGADGGEAAVALPGLGDVVAVLAHGHGAELVDDDFLALQTVAALAEDDGAARGELDGQGDAQHDRGDEGEDEQRQDDVRHPLVEGVDAEEGGFHHGDDRHAAHQVDARLDEVVGEDVRHQVGRGGGVLEVFQQAMSDRGVQRWRAEPIAARER